VRLLKFCPDSGTGVVEPPVFAASVVEVSAGNATVSLKFASTGRICWMSFCNAANPVFRFAGTTFVWNNVPNTLAKAGETGLKLDAPSAVVGVTCVVETCAEAERPAMTAKATAKEIIVFITAIFVFRVTSAWFIGAEQPAALKKPYLGPFLYRGLTLVQCEAAAPDRKAK